MSESLSQGNRMDRERECVCVSNGMGCRWTVKETLGSGVSRCDVGATGGPWTVTNSSHAT